MDLDDIKAELDRIFAAGTRSSTRDQAAGLRHALVDFKVAVGQLREGLERSERELATARQELADYTRRGDMARNIGDEETARIADEFAARGRERVDVLERKVLVQRDELQLAEREFEATKVQYQNASRGLPLDTGPSIGDGAGGNPAEQALLDQRAREAAVEAQLAHLKKKLGERS